MHCTGRCNEIYQQTTAKHVTIIIYVIDTPSLHSHSYIHWQC